MDFATILYEAHSGWRYVVIIVTLVAIVKMLIGWIGNGAWSAFDQRLGMLTPITYDIQLLLGLLLWITQRRWLGGDSTASWEHPVTMILAVTAAHITSSRVKKAEDDQTKYRTAAIGFLIAGLLLSLGVARITHLI